MDCSRPGFSVLHHLLDIFIMLHISEEKLRQLAKKTIFNKIVFQRETSIRARKYRIYMQKNGYKIY